MPSSLIVVALVVAWLVVLVPMVVRKRQEVARTTDSTLAARVVRSGAGADSDTERDIDADAELDRRDRREADQDADADLDDDRSADAEPDDYAEDVEPAGDPHDSRRYRPGRGGYDPEAAARTAKAKYAFRQRVVLLVIVAAIAAAVAAAVGATVLWWAHGALALGLVGYLTYLRRQVRIEEEIRQRRLARMAPPRRSHARPAEDEHEYDHRGQHAAPTRTVHPGATVVDIDDEDPWFDDLGDPDVLPYRRAVGE